LNILHVKWIESFASLADVVKSLRQVSDLSSFTGQVGLTMITNVAIAGIGMVTGLLAARLLGPQGRGELAVIQTWPMVIVSIALLGLGEAVVYFSSNFPQQAGRYLASALALILPASVVFVGVGWWLMPWLLQAQSAAVIAAAQVFLAVMLIPYALIGVPHEILRAVGAWRAWNFFRVLPHLGWLVALLAAWLWSGWATSITLSQAYIATHLVLIFPIVLLTWRYVTRPYTVQSTLFRPLLGYGLPSMLNILPQTMNLRLDQLLMAAFFQPQLLGLYWVAVVWSGAAAPLLRAVGPVLFPRLSKISDLRQQNQLLRRVIRLTGPAILGLTLVMLLLTPFMLPLLFGLAYRDAVPAALILVVANGFSYLNFVLEDGLRGLGHPRQVLQAELVGLGATGILLWLLLPGLKIVGAALASLGAYATVCTYLILAMRRSLALSAPEKHLLPRF
jgi:O-antigen/teichoic acid export membrane protein